MIRLIKEDCITWLASKKLEFDLAVTDPPYRWNFTTGGRAKNDVFAKKWQGSISGKDIVKASLNYNNVDFQQWMPVVFESLTPNSHCYVMTNDKNLQSALNAATYAGFKLHNVLAWKKNNCTPNKWYMKNLEYIIFLYKGKAFPINNLNSAQLIEVKNIPGKTKRHPTEKPVGLLKFLIENSSAEGQHVLDPFMGCGSTGVAAVELNRAFTGIEIDPKYYDLALAEFNKYHGNQIKTA